MFSDSERKALARSERENVRQLARTHTVAALKVLTRIMNSPNADHKDRIACARYILDRGWGRPVQEVVVDPGSSRSLTPELLGRLTNEELQVFSSLYSKMVLED